MSDLKTRDRSPHAQPPRGSRSRAAEPDEDPTRRAPRPRGDEDDEPTGVRRVAQVEPTPPPTAASPSARSPTAPLQLPSSTRAGPTAPQKPVPAVSAAPATRDRAAPTGPAKAQPSTPLPAARSSAPSPNPRPRPATAEHLVPNGLPKPAALDPPAPARSPTRDLAIGPPKPAALDPPVPTRSPTRDLAIGPPKPAALDPPAPARDLSLGPPRPATLERPAASTPPPTPAASPDRAAPTPLNPATSIARPPAADPTDHDELLETRATTAPRHRRLSRRHLLVGGLGLGALLLLVLVFTRAGAPACDEADAGLAGVWDPARSDAVHAALTATGLVHAEGTWERLAPRLDAYADAWRTARRGACLEAPPAPDVPDLRTACLQRRRAALGALVDGLVAADARAVEHAIAATEELPALAPCSDRAALAAAAPPAPDPAEVAELRARLEPARAALALGKPAEGLAIAGPLLARARELGVPALVAEVTGVVGRLQRDAGDVEAAEASLTAAVWLSDQVRDDALLADHMAALIHLLGERRRHDDALRWLRHADTVRSRLPPEAPGQARLLTAIATVLAHQARVDEAIPLHERALAITEAAHGEGDARVRVPLLGLGDALLGKGDVPRARAAYERALALEEAAFGPQHPALARVLGDLADLAARTGDADGALAHRQRAVAILAAARGPDDPDLGRALHDLGGALVLRGEFAAARPALERALAIDEKVLGPEHSDLVPTLLALAGVADRLDDAAAARTHAARALTIADKARPPDEPRLAAALGLLGALELRQGNLRAALPRLGRALALREARSDTAAADLAESRFRLAVALRQARRDPERQQSLADAALAGLRAEGAERHTAAIAEIERWLADVPAAKPTKKKKKKPKKKKKKK